MRRRRVRHLLLGVVTILVAVSLWPVSYLAAPRWNVSVVTPDGRSLVGINVRLVYQDHSAEGRSHELTVMTDEQGRARFAPQYESASLLRRVFYSLSSAGAGAHASFGRHAWVFAFGKGFEGQATSGQFVTDWRGTPDVMESTIVVRPTRNDAP